MDLTLSSISDRTDFSIPEVQKSQVTSGSLSLAYLVTGHPEGDQNDCLAIKTGHARLH
jgi:hypothetical protein